MRHPVPAQVSCSPVAGDTPPPRLVDNVMQDPNFGVPPHERVLVSHRLETIALPAKAYPFPTEELGQKVLVREGEVLHVGGFVEVRHHSSPEGFAWVEDEHARIQEMVCRSGVRANGGWAGQGGGVGQGRVRAVLLPPCGRRPGVPVEVADAGMVCRDAVLGG